MDGRDSTAALLPSQTGPVEEASLGRRGLIDRPRLSRLVERIANSKVVLVRAPAGYGKTVLLLQWFHELRRRGSRPRWLTLAEPDNDPQRLVAHLFAVLGSEPDEKSALSYSLEQAPLFGGEMALVGELARRAPFVLFLDELEHLRSQQSLGILSRLIGAMPRGSSIVLASREVSGLPLAALRLRGGSFEVDFEDLRLSEREAEQFLRSRGVSLEREVLSELLARTEGWIAGLQLFVLALGRAEDAREVVGDLSGSRCEIAVYLAEEAFDRQPAAVKLFLLRTSILDRLCSSLCDAVAAQSDSQPLLERIEDSGLFLLPTDGERRWYRYHPLFAEFLRRRLSQQDEGAVANLHRTASRWYSDHGFARGAVKHAFASHDLDFAATAVRRFAMEMFRQGQFTTVVQWSAKLPQELLDIHPSVREAAAWAHTCLRNFHEARREIDELRRLSQRVELGSGVLGSLAALESLILTFEDRGPEALEVSRRSAQALRSPDPFVRGAFQNSMAIGLIAAGEFEVARSLLLEARANHQKARSLLGEVYSLCLSALCQAVQGKLDAGAVLYTEAQSLSGLPGEVSRYVPPVVDAYFAELLYERDEIVQAEAVLRPSLRLITESALPDMVACAYVTLVRIEAARGSFDAASRLLEEAEAHGFRFGFSRLVVAVRWERVRLALSRGAIREARKLRKQLYETFADSEPRGFYHHSMETEARDIGEIRFQIRCGNSKDVLPLIRSELTRADKTSRRWRALRLKILLAEALDGAGRRAAAIRVLHKALHEGATEGFVRSFADEGRALMPLLRLLLESSKESFGTDDSRRRYVERILDASERGRSTRPPPAKEIVAPSPALSNREREILSAVGEGLSNDALAKKFFLSEHTVKWHLQRIYGKLGAHSRARAIAVARRQGLLP